MTAVISVCIFKKLIEIGEFSCSHFNIEDGRKCEHFQCIMLFYFKNGKKATETQRKICAACAEGAVTDRMYRKWFAKFLATIEIFAK